MSTPDPTQTPASRRREAALFVVVPAACALILWSVLFAERAGSTLDLQLIAPPRLPPGHSVPLRAFLVDHADTVRPAFIRAPVEVRLVRPPSETLAVADLTDSALIGMEGMLAFPGDARGGLRLVARAEYEGETVVVERALRVAPDVHAGPPSPRLAMPLSHYEAHAMSGVPGETPPSMLDLRALGGGCVPELRCILLVLAGEPAVRVEIEPTPAVTVARGPPSVERVGIHAFAVTVHGPEATVEVLASRAGRVVARRSFRLPVILAGRAVDVDSTLLEVPASPTIEVRSVGDRALIADAFRDGLWNRTVTVAAAEAREGFELPGGALAPGLWRIQVRGDPFAAGAATSRFVHVRAGGTPLEAARVMVAERYAGFPEAAIAADPGAAAAFVLAAAEMDLRPFPAAQGSRARVAPGLSARRIALRWAGALALLLLGLFVAAVVARRGLEASEEARELLARESLAPPQSRRRDVLTVLAVTAAVALAFVAAAVMFAARVW